MPTRLRRVPDRFQRPSSTGTRKTPSRWSLPFFNSLLVPDDGKVVLGHADSGADAVAER